MRMVSLEARHKCLFSAYTVAIFPNKTFFSKNPLTDYYFGIILYSKLNHDLKHD